MYIKNNNIMFVWYQTSIIFFAGLVTASFLFYWVPIEILRYFVIVLLAMQIWLEVNTGQNSFLTSPLFLLSSIALFFFSFLQGMTYLFTEYPAYLSENPGNSIMTVSGSLAERYIVVFSMIIFIAHASLTFYIKVNLKSEQHIQIKQTPKLSIIFFIAIAFITIINVIYFNSPFDRGSNTYQTLRSVSPPLQAFMLVYLVRQAIERGKIFNILLAMVFLFSFSGLLLILEGKIPIFIGLAISLYWMRLVGISIKGILVGGSILGVLLTGGLCVNFLLKYTQNSTGWNYHLDQMMEPKFLKLGDKSNPNKLGNHLSKNSDVLTNKTNPQTDDSGLGNSFTNSGTVSNSTSAPTNIISTLNPLDHFTSGGTTALSNGNLTSTQSSVGTTYVSGTFLPKGVGKWVWEVTVTNVVDQFYIGLKNVVDPTVSASAESDGGVYYRATGQKDIDGTASSYGASYTDGDVIRVEWNAAGNSIEFFKNNASQGSITPTAGVTWKMMFIHNDNTSAFTVNFGATDFAHTPTADFVSLSTSDVGDHFSATLYTGTGSQQDITTGQEADFENSANNAKKQLKVLTDTIYNLTAPSVQKIFALKLIWRQAEVINCFNNVIFKHWDETFIFSKQLFW
ncbi:MAG: hypothetical protein VX693_08195 [Pseudomonadota bacterium]|nr:hypothetical protein [Pseudomonadota bacterium]